MKGFVPWHDDKILLLILVFVLTVLAVHLVFMKFNLILPDRRGGALDIFSSSDAGKFQGSKRYECVIFVSGGRTSKVRCVKVFHR